MSERQGHWVMPEVNYIDPKRRFCTFCGRPIARRYWQETNANGLDEVYCSPDHAVSATTYPVVVREMTPAQTAE